MKKSFKALGINFRNTPLEVREAVTFEESGCKQFLMQLREILDLDEALILSTCNRTEVYYYSDENRNDEIASLIDTFHNNTTYPSKTFFVPMDHDSAIEHLFEVSLGVDSMILGDIQITNQVKKAYQWSADEAMAGPFLHRLMHTIFYTNKKMVQSTAFRDGSASMASAAVEITEHFISNFINPKILLIGLGEIGNNVAENLSDTKASITLSNRTFSKASELSDKLGYSCVPFENLAKAINEAHVVISAVQADELLIKPDLLIPSDAPRLFIDLAVPRSIDEKVGHVPGCLVYNVDQLKEKTSEALKRREEAIPQVKVIVQESISEFDNWSQEMEVSPTIRKFKQALEEIRKQEMSRYVGKLDDQQLQHLDKVTKSMMQRVVKLPALQLKAACKRGDADNLAEVLHDLFDLEKQIISENE